MSGVLVRARSASARVAAAGWSPAVTSSSGRGPAAAIVEEKTSATSETAAARRRIRRDFIVNAPFGDRRASGCPAG